MLPQTHPFFHFLNSAHAHPPLCPRTCVRTQDRKRAVACLRALLVLCLANLVLLCVFIVCVSYAKSKRLLERKGFTDREIKEVSLLRRCPSACVHLRVRIPASCAWAWIGARYHDVLHAKTHRRWRATPLA